METWTSSSLDLPPTDITIVLDGCKFHLHKDVLIQNCDYFKAMFSSQMSETWQSEIKVQLVDRIPFQILADGFYSGHLELSEENIFSVTVASYALQLTSPLSTQCSDFLKKLINHEHCFEIMDFTTVHLDKDVYSSARSYCLNHFLTLCEEQSFLNLSLDELKDYLLDEFLVADGISEILVALKRWCVSNEFMDIETLKEIIFSILGGRTETIRVAGEEIAAALMNGDDFMDEKWAYLGSRYQKKDCFMFWSQLSTTKSRDLGHEDVIKLGDLDSCQAGNIQASRFDSMTTVFQDRLCVDTGSALCVKGPFVYLSGGGPKIGHTNWIRNIWAFSAFEDDARWRAIGQLPETKHYHAMVAVNKKLYIFGGFGKFRDKNSRLESFNIYGGQWESLAPMPIHEYQPKATSHHQSIYYITKSLDLYTYSVSTNQWSNCLINKIPLFNSSKEIMSQHYPRTLHITRSELKRHSLYVTVLLSGPQFCIVSHPLSEEPNGPRNEVTHTPPVNRRYFGSCSMNGKVFIFLRTQDGSEVDEMVEGKKSDKDENDQLQVLSYTPETGQLKEVTTISSVCGQKSSILPVPYVPKSFQIAQ